MVEAPTDPQLLALQEPAELLPTVAVKMAVGVLARRTQDYTSYGRLGRVATSCTRDVAN